VLVIILISTYIVQCTSRHNSQRNCTNEDKTEKAKDKKTKIAKWGGGGVISK